MKPACFIVIGVLLTATSPLAAVVLNQVDNFENGTTQSWIEGGSSPNPPTNVATGGPAGANDNFLRNISAGSSAGSKMVMFNANQWTGDYLSEGVNRIEADMINLGNTTLRMRIALTDGSGYGYYASNDPAVLTPGSGWQHVVFMIDDASLTDLTFGYTALSDLLSGVSEMRILSSADPNYVGDTIAGTVGVDNITALPEPASLVLLTLGAVAAARRRR